MYCSQESDSSIYAAARTESVLLIAHFTKDVKNLLREGGSCDERLSRKANDISDQVERTCSGEGRTFRISTGSLSLLFSHQLLHDLCLMLYCFRQIDEYRSTADAKLRSRPTQANKSVMLCRKSELTVYHLLDLRAQCSEMRQGRSLLARTCTQVG